MAPSRTSWKGFLKLSLVSVPVKAFTANEASAEVRLNQLHRDCHSRVKYSKQCPEHGELGSDQIVSGYEYAKGEYVVVDPEDVDKLRTRADRSVAIDGFVPDDAIDARYFAGKTWYLLPDGVAGERPYALLHRGMVDNGVCAIAQVVMSGREQLVLLRPMGRLLVMSGLYYPARVKAAGEFEDEVAEIDCKPEELALANTLIGASRVEDFAIERYADSYVSKLKQLIELKIDGREVVAAPDHEEPRILNLMDALKKSVAEAQARAAGLAVGGEAEAADGEGGDEVGAAGAGSGDASDGAVAGAADEVVAEGAEGAAAPGRKKMAPSAGRKKRKAQGS